MAIGKPKVNAMAAGKPRVSEAVNAALVVAAGAAMARGVMDLDAARVADARVNCWTTPPPRQP